jgi:hypothetical protein
LLTVPTEALVDDDEFDFDYSLVGQGIVVTDNYLSVILDGTVFSSDNTEPGNKNYSSMPINSPNSNVV